MAIIKCEKGHYFDNEKFAQCPHCEAGMENDTVTVALTSQQVDNYAASYIRNETGHQKIQLDDERTVGIYTQKNGDSQRYIAGWLVCVDGAAKGVDYGLYAGFNKIGRGNFNDVVLKDDLQVSRETHCSVVYEEKKNSFYVVPKLGYLTYLNGELVEQAEEISDGQVISIGESSLEFRAFCKGDKKWEK